MMLVLNRRQWNDIIEEYTDTVQTGYEGKIEIEGNALTDEIPIEDLNGYIREYAEYNEIPECAVMWDIEED